MSRRKVDGEIGDKGCTFYLCFARSLSLSVELRSEVSSTFELTFPVHLPFRSLRFPFCSPPFAQVGSYHYCSGVEASSSASLAAYLNSLTFAVEDGNAWFSKGPVWKVRGGTYW